MAELAFQAISPLSKDCHLGQGCQNCSFLAENSGGTDAPHPGPSKSLWSTVLLNIYPLVFLGELGERFALFMFQVVFLPILLIQRASWACAGVPLYSNLSPNSKKRLISSKFTS